MGDLRSISISSIRENPVALRTVNRTSEEYLGLVSSIRSKGFLGAITVRPKQDKETGEDYFELVDGLHRFSAAKDAGLENINVDVTDLNDDQVLEAQIMANIHKVETKPVEYSQQLRRILARNPLMTEAELASTLGKSAVWISQRLGLNKITNEEIQRLVNEGKIKLANAYALAKLPAEEMANFTDRAMTEQPDVFVPQVNARVKELREARRKGKDANPPVFTPVAHLQKLKDVKTEYETSEVGNALLATHAITDPAAAFKMAISWMLHLDPESVSSQEAKDVERKATRAEQKKKKDVERSQKKAETAKVKADEAAKAAEVATAAFNTQDGELNGTDWHN